MALNTNDLLALLTNTITSNGNNEVSAADLRSVFEQVIDSTHNEIDNPIDYGALVNIAQKLASVLRTGQISGLEVSKVSDTEILVSSGSYQININDGNEPTIYTLEQDVSINQAQGLPSSGSTHIVIRVYDGIADADAVSSYDYNNEFTFDFFSKEPTGRGTEKGLTLKKVFYEGSVLFLSSGYWSIYDSVNADEYNVQGVMGFNYTINNDRSVNEIDLVSDGRWFRRGVLGANKFEGVMPATNDIFSGINRTQGGTGLPVRMHILGRLNATSDGFEYVENSEIIPGGTYYPWWNYYDSGATSIGENPIPVPTNRWCTYDILVFPFSNNVILSPSTVTYSTSAEAINDPVHKVNTRTIDTILIGRVVAKQGETDLSLAIFLQGERFRVST